MSLNIVRVSALPGTLVANTIYLVAASADELQLVVVGTNIAEPRSTTLKSATTAEINSAIATAIADYYTKSEIDTKVAADIATALASYDTSATVNSKINTAISELDLSNSALYAADITARDALTLTKGSFVFVADASADTTVTSGSALYFYNLAETSWTKVAEYESMDIDMTAVIATAFPNKAVLDLLTDSSGQLYYNGAPVGGVIEGAHAW